MSTRKIASLLFFFAAACGDQTAPDLQRRVNVLEAVSPSTDTVALGATRLLEVRALDGRGRPVAGVEIAWQVAQPADLVEPAVDTTDAAGISQATLRIGDTAGPHGVLATTREPVTRSFTFHVLPPPLQRIALTPRRLDLTARQTALVVAQPLDSAGNVLEIPLRWGSNNAYVATVDSNGIVLARRAGSAVIHVNATVPPFTLDSIVVNVRAAVVARMDVKPQPENLIFNEVSRFTAMAFDSMGGFIDAERIVWTATPGLAIWHREVFADSTIVYVKAQAMGASTLDARIAQLDTKITPQVIADPLIERTEMVTPSFTYGGVTIGPSGQWYYVSNVGGSRSAADSMAVVRTGQAGRSSWTRSEAFVEPSRAEFVRPRATISIDADENLYVPTQNGVHSISGSNGETRWLARIGEVYGNIALADSLVIAARSAELVALARRDGSTVWRRAAASALVAPFIDEARGVVYAATAQDVSALDLRTGAVKWRVAMPLGAKSTAVAIAANGDLYLGANDAVIRITPDGVIARTQSVHGVPVGSPLIDAQGRVFIATGGGAVYSFTPELDELWQVRIAPFRSESVYGADAPVLDRDGTLYFGMNGEMHAVRNGKLLWSHWDLSTGWEYLWMLGPDGLLYATAHYGVPRIRTAGLDPQAQWPMAHRTPARSSAR